MFKKLKEFLVGSWEELAKVTWPIKTGKNFTFYEKIEELLEATMVVIVASCIFGVIIYGYDVLVVHTLSKFIIK